MRLISTRWIPAAEVPQAAVPDDHSSRHGERLPAGKRDAPAGVGAAGLTSPFSSTTSAVTSPRKLPGPGSMLFAQESKCLRHRCCKGRRNLLNGDSRGDVGAVVKGIRDGPRFGFAERSHGYRRNVFFLDQEISRRAWIRGPLRVRRKTALNPKARLADRGEDHPPLVALVPTPQMARTSAGAVKSRRSACLQQIREKE